MIYTSYFGALKNSLDSETMTAISIARRSPLQFRGHSFFDLAPPTSLIRQYKSGQINDDEYLVVYNKILNSLNPHDVYQRLLDMAKNTIPVLCCYRELPRKPRPLVAGMNWQNNLKKTLDKF